MGYDILYNISAKYCIISFNYELIHQPSLIIFPDIIDILGYPYLQAPNCLIYNLDCLDAITKLPDEWVSLTVTSPPYNIGKEYEQKLPLEDYLTWCQQWIAEIYRIARPDGTFWLNLGYLSIGDRAKAIPIPYLLWDKIPFYLIQEIIWHYGAGAGGVHFNFANRPKTPDYLT